MMHVPFPHFLLFYFFIVCVSRRFCLFSLLAVAPHLSATNLPLVLTPACLRVLFSALSHEKQDKVKDALLTDTARSTLSALTAAARAEPSLVVPLFIALTGPGGSGKFDQATKTRTVAQLMASLTEEQVHNHVVSLLNSFLTTTVEGNQMDLNLGAQDHDDHSP
jgi:hypothetical protein